MKCPKCGAEMTKVKRGDGWVCVECGTRARVIVDAPDPPAPAPQIVPMPYPVEPWPKPYRPEPPYMVWYGPTTAEPPRTAGWIATCASTDSIPGLS